MTVSSSTNRADYSGNGSTTEFATNFRFLQNEDLKVILTNTTTNVETEQIIDSDYTVTGEGLDAGGTVTMVTAPPSGYKLSILRSVAKTQETDYVENDDFPAKSHEDALDKLTMICQEQQDEIDRSLKLSESQIATGLTVPTAEEGKFLQWDDDGNLQNVTISASGELITTSFGEDVIVTSDAEDLRDLIEVYGQDEVYTKQGISDIIPASDYFNGGGAADAYTLSAISPRLAPTALVDGMRLRAIFDDSNTGACTVNPFGIGAIDIKLKGGVTDPSADDIVADEEATLIYRTSPSVHAELVTTTTTSIFSEEFVSTAQTIVQGGTITLAHGLSSEPKIIKMYAICTTAENGWSIGDKVWLDQKNSDAATSRHSQLSWDATNIRLIMSNTSPVFVTSNKTTGNSVVLTNGNWDIYLEAWA